MTDETLHSVIFRTGPITPADYAEAIKDLQNASRQAECIHMCCSVCEDTGHTAETCHHNPLVAARKWAQATGVWQCWHCGFVATNGDEAKDHFGANDQELAKCQTEAAFKAGVDAAAKAAARDRPAPAIDEVHVALVEQYDAMLEDMDAFTNRAFEEKTEAEITRERVAMDRYRKAEDMVMRLSYPIWRAQNLERSITVNAHCDGRIKGFLPPFPELP